MIRRAWPDNDLRVDDGLYIRELQEYLRALSFRQPGWPLLGIDGIYGAETAQAVAAFQRWFGLEETGLADRVTWDAIAAAAGAVTAGDPPPVWNAP